MRRVARRPFCFRLTASPQLVVDATGRPRPVWGRIDRGIGHRAGVPGASESPGVETASYGVTLVRVCRPLISRKVLSDRCCPLRSTRATYVLNGGGERDGCPAACCVLRDRQDLNSWEYGTEPG